MVALREGLLMPSGKGAVRAIRYLKSGTEKVPQRTCATKILPNFRVNIRVRFASKPLFSLDSTLELFRKLFGAVRAIFWL